MAKEQYSGIKNAGEVSTESGRTRGEAVSSLIIYYDQVFGLGGSGDIMDFLKTIKGDSGLVALLDEIAQKRAVARGLNDFPAEHAYNRVEEMLIGDNQLPEELYPNKFSRRRSRKVSRRRSIKAPATAASEAEYLYAAVPAGINPSP